jgi:alpha-beta hydrolase superfamily lysophospholipase
VLYIHGFNDYFFQREMAKQFVANGYNFYALDLRKYGRSILPHQKQCNTRKIKEYYADIDTALSLILNEKNNFILLCGHSTGGLTASLYADEGRKRKFVNALWLNSPFFDMNLNVVLKRLGVPLVSSIGGMNPNIAISLGSSTLYGKSLHIDYYGEWGYNLKWKLLKSPKMKSGWVRAMYRTQHRLRKGLKIACPVLVMHSDKSLSGNKWDEKFHHADIVLNVDDIIKYAPKLGANVTVQSIEGGKHDLILSEKPVRETVYKNLFAWLKTIKE